MLTVCAFALCRSRGMPRGLARARAPIRLIYYTISRKFASVCRKVTENARYHFEDSAAGNARERLEMRAASPRYDRSAATLRPAKVPLTAAPYRPVRLAFATNARPLFCCSAPKKHKKRTPFGVLNFVKQTQSASMAPFLFIVLKHLVHT